MIEIHNLTFGYTKRIQLFKDLSLVLKPGNIYGLLGKNGAGKTTLLKHMAGLLFPHQGQCMLFGNDARQRLPESLQDIFLIPEEFSLPSMKGVAFAAVNAPFYPNFDVQEFYKLLDELQVDAQAKLSNLSYGQKKKFLLAFGMATHAKILIMDEPTNGLDIPSKSQFRKLIASNFDENRAVVISSHQVRDLSNLIDHVIILDQGKIIFYHDIQSVSEKFAFGLLHGDDAHEVIYMEDVLGGKAGMYKSQEQQTEVDMEILFNAVMHNVADIEHHLNQQQ